ncbi:MAG: carbamoyl phosphate synthase large subunit, partial [Clostridium sp.]|nr:carbamoyl phosphate synthase large subunit [Clostridium sp.]
LGPEMRSTGEVLGLAKNVGEAFFKAQEATKTELPTEGCVLISVSGSDKTEAIEVAKIFEECGFSILATENTYKRMKEAGVKVERINKMQEGRPNIADVVMNGKIQLIINTPATKEESIFDDSYVRKTAIKAKVPYITTLAAAKATAEGIKAVLEQGEVGVMSLQDIHATIQ